MSIIYGMEMRWRGERGASGFPEDRGPGLPLQRGPSPRPAKNEARGNPGNHSLTHERLANA